MEKNILNIISPYDALDILRQLANSDSALKQKIIELAKNLHNDVDIEAISDDVFDTLDAIDVYELWDRSGERSYGYITPEDMAVEMVEEALEPFITELERLHNLGLHYTAKLHCMGLLKGIYRYDKDSESQFKEWATDVPAEMFAHVLEKWKRMNLSDEDKKEMKEFINGECPDWAALANNIQ